MKKNWRKAILFVCRKELMEQISLGKEDHQFRFLCYMLAIYHFPVETEDFKNEEKRF